MATQTRKNAAAEQPPMRRRKRRRRGVPPLLFILAGLLLFGGGFLLGTIRASAQEQTDWPMIDLQPSEEISQDTQLQTPEPDHDAAPWNLRLVRADQPLGEDFEVPELTKLKNGHAVDSRIYPALQQMMDDCRAAGLKPLICSSYRTRDKQEELFQNKVNTLLNQGLSQTEAEEQAARWVARPGTSEHETGLAVDIVDTDYQLLDEKQEQTPVQQWLMAHCAEYGFILRYPTEKSDCTGIGYEPWHYRYVGQAAAQEIMEQGICLEEYLAA